LACGSAPLRILWDPSSKFRRIAVKAKAPVVKQLYRLSVEPLVVERLAKLAARLGEPRSRLATRLFTDAVRSAKLIAPRTAKRTRA
jgi:hypothetical protein